MEELHHVSVEVRDTFLRRCNGEKPTDRAQRNYGYSLMMPFHVETVSMESLENPASLQAGCSHHAVGCIGKSIFHLPSPSAPGEGENTESKVDNSRKTTSLLSKL